MLKTIITISPVIINTNTLERSFISSKEEIFEPLTFDSSDIEQFKELKDFLVGMLKKFISGIDVRLLSFKLISCTKNENEISINYTVLLPDTITISNAYVKSYNISIFHPLARKALAYA